MHSFSSLALLLVGAGAAFANSVTFKSLDETDRTVTFTPNAGLAAVPSVKVPAGQSIKVDIPTGWIGNWYSVSDGAEDVPGMLGEVAFDGWNGITFFDVSAIVNPNDHSGVKELYPAGDNNPTSGCKVFPCNNAYYVWNDIQTKATQEKDLICTLGNGSLDERDQAEVAADEPVFKREFVMGKWTR